MKFLSQNKIVFSAWILSFLISGPLIAQNQAYPNITVTFNDLSLKEILNRLEANTAYDFFYKEADLPSQKLTFSFEEEPLDELLEAVLTPTTLNFIAYKDYAIVLVPKQLAAENFTVDYYKAREEATKVTEEEQGLTIGNINELATSGNAVIKGEVTDAQTNEPIIGASVLIRNLELGTTTDIDGSFELEVPAGIHYIIVTYVGYENLNQSLRVLSDGEINLQLDKGAINLEEVTVSAKAADAGINDAQISVTKLDAQSIKETPTFLGEADVVKTLLLNTGVSSVGEGATGFNVRGGDVDQNLILQDNGLLLNASHALGFFSYFNTDLIEDVALYKAIMPAQYGGRLSSVLDVKLREGDYNNYKIQGGVGPVTSRLSFEGPIVKDKISVIVGGRASYADWVLRLVDNVEVKNSSAFFYDTNLKLSAKLGDRNTLILGGYAAQDEFTYNDEFGFDYTSYLGQLILKTIFSEQLYSNLTIAYNKYESTRFDFAEVDGSQLENNIDYIKFKEQITFSPTTLMKLDAGISSILYQVEPGNIVPLENSTFIGRSVPTEKGLESAAFANLEYELSEAILLSGGLRLSAFQFLGPSTVREYADNENPATNEVIGETNYGGGDIIESYLNLEPRFSVRYRLNGQSSLKTGYSRTVQYINQIFNSDSPTPVSQWQLSNNFLLPNTSHNFSLGYFRNFKENTWETNAEVYYRSIDQLFDFKDFAELTANPNLETEILEGTGRTYGFEFSLKKKEGKVNGSVNYTYSRSERQIEGINDGDWYFSNFDKPHDLAFVFNFQPNRRNTVTLNFIYASGRPTTPPVGNFSTSSGLVIPVYANRNAGRIPDYHRLDLAYTVGQGYKRDRKFRTSWTISLYNVYGRRNAFSVYFTQAAFERAQANKLTILGSIFPSLTFNFEAL